MAKEKKITVQLSAKKLKTHVSIYHRVTYNRKSNFFTLSDIVAFDFWERNEFDTIEEAELFIASPNGTKYKKHIEAIVRFEVNTFKEKFTLKDISKRIDSYSNIVGVDMSLYVEIELFEVLADHLTHNQYMKVLDMEEHADIDLKYSNTGMYFLLAHYLYLSKDLGIDISSILSKNKFDKLILTISFLEFTIYCIENKKFITINNGGFKIGRAHV